MRIAFPPRVLAVASSPLATSPRINAGLTVLQEGLAINRLLVRQAHQELSQRSLDLTNILSQLDHERVELINAIRFLAPFEDEA